MKLNKKDIVYQIIDSGMFYYLRNHHMFFAKQLKELGHSFDYVPFQAIDEANELEVGQASFGVIKYKNVEIVYRRRYENYNLSIMVEYIDHRGEVQHFFTGLKLDSLKGVDEENDELIVLQNRLPELLGKLTKIDRKNFIFLPEIECSLCRAKRIFESYISHEAEIYSLDDLFSFEEHFTPLMVTLLSRKEYFKRIEASFGKKFKDVNEVIIPILDREKVDSKEFYFFKGDLYVSNPEGSFEIGQPVGMVDSWEVSSFDVNFYEEYFVPLKKV